MLKTVVVILAAFAVIALVAGLVYLFLPRDSTSKSFQSFAIILVKDYFVCLCYITTPSLDWIFFLNLHKIIEVTWCLLADVSIVKFYFR